MPNTRKMQWSYPARDSDPWYEQFESLVTAVDSSGYAHREDRHTRISGGGTVSFVASSGVVEWSEDIEILSPISGFKITVPVPTVPLSIDDGGVIYVDLVRFPTQNVTVSAQSAASAPNTNDAYVLVARNGGAVYWANGARVADGESKSLFGGPAAGLQQVEIVSMATRASHDSTTPLVVGGAAFNPLDHDKPGYSRTLTFRAVAANGDIGITTFVKLVNVTDGDEIASLSFSSTSQAKDEVVLVEGAGIGQVDLVEKIYEVRIGLDVSPVNPTETVELYNAEIRVVSVPV